MKVYHDASGERQPMIPGLHPKKHVITWLSLMMLAATSFAQVSTLPPPEAPVAPPKRGLFTLDDLMTKKVQALESAVQEQKLELAKTSLALEKERQIEGGVFDSSAYLFVNIVNNAPTKDYRLESTEIYLDKASKPIAIGSRRFQGLPRNTEVFAGSIAPGCHELTVKATYTRLSNTVISQFKGINRVEKITKTQAFVAQNGYRLKIEVQGFEAVNTFAHLYRGPQLRFNNSVSPNFLFGSPLASLDEVVNQGRVHISYQTEDSSSHRLISKSLRIDGLPVLANATHDQTRDENLVFSSPLADGPHKLHVELLFGEIKRITGGPMYNFRLKFDRDFVVVSGQTTNISLIGLPKNGFRSEQGQSRYARATTQVVSTQNAEFFKSGTCKEILEKAATPSASATTPPAPRLKE